MKAIFAARLVATAVLFSIVNGLVQATLYDDSQEHLASCNFRNYAALGDSYSAGLYADPRGRLKICRLGPATNCTIKRCSKNVGAYGYVFANEAPKIPHFNFRACSGADTFACRDDQVSKLSINTDLITFTIGGDNDDAFANTVKWCTVEHIRGKCPEAIANATKALESLGPAVQELYTAMKAQAPSAKIVHLGYVHFWPAYDIPELCQIGYLRAPSFLEKTKMNALVTGVNTLLEDLAKKNGITFVNVNPRFEGHRLCDFGQGDNTWIRWSLIGWHETEWNYHNGIFHPTYEGQDAYLAELKQIFKYF